MKLTSKGRYAVTAMLDLAFHSKAGPVTLAHISRRQDISLSYLEQLFTRLRKQELVCSTRGPGGGYSLARPADEIAVSEVVAAVDEGVARIRALAAIGQQSPSDQRDIGYTDGSAGNTNGRKVKHPERFTERVVAKLRDDDVWRRADQGDHST